MRSSTTGGESFGNYAGGLLFPGPVTVELTCYVDEYRLPGCSSAAVADVPERASDTGRVSDQPPDDVRFELSPDDIKRLGLTVLEQIRHKYTGELPDRAIRQNRRTRIDQTRRSRLPYDCSAKTEDVPEAEMLPPPLFPDGEFGPEDFAGFKESLISSLGYISGQIQRAINGLCEAEDIRQLTGYAASWRRTYDRQFLKEANSDQDIHAAAAGCQSLVTSVIASGALTVESKADLLETLALAHRSLDGPDIIRAMISELETGDVRLCPAVLEREYAGRILLNAMEAKLPKLNPDRLSQVAVATIVPIARRIGRTDDMFFGSFFELRQLGFMLERLDNPAHSSSANAEVAAAASALAKCFPMEVNDILKDRNRVNHGLAAELMRVVRRLYVPEYYRPQPIPQGLGPLLEALFYEKFDNYRWLEEVKAVRLTFNRLARMCRLHPFFTL